MSTDFRAASLLGAFGLLALGSLAFAQSPTPSPGLKPFALPYKGDIKIPLVSGSAPASPNAQAIPAASGSTTVIWPAISSGTKAPLVSSTGNAPGAKPAPEPATTRQVVDSLSDGDIQQALELLRSNYINSSALAEDAVNRATLQGLLERLGAGAVIQQAQATGTSDSPFRSEILDDRIGYVRIGSLTKDHLAEFDAALGNFSTKKLASLIVDLRATPPNSDFDLAAEFVKRLTPKGKMLFTVHRPSAKQERMFTSNQDPAFRGVVVTLVSRDTAGSAEVIAGVLRTLDNALVVGQNTAGQAAEFTDLPLRGGKTLHIAVAEVKLPENLAIFPEGLKPDLPVAATAREQAEALRIGLEKGVSGLVFQTERVRLNEAALVAGVNPELDEVEAAQKVGRPKTRPSASDPVLQRAVDLITTIQIFAGKTKS